MRILNVFQTYALFGKGNHAAKVQTISRLLVLRGHAVEILAVDYGRRLASYAEESEGVRIDYVGAGLKARSISLSPEAAPLLLRRVRDFDVVHIYGIYDLLGLYAGAACRARSVPYVVEPMGMFVPIMRNLRMKRAYHAFAGRPLMAGAARLIATSQQEADELASQGIDRRHVAIRLNGLDLDEFRDLPPRGRLRQELGIPAAAPLVLYFGRLNRKKALDVLAEAFAQLPAEVHLAVVGPDEHDGTVEALLRFRSERHLEGRLHVAGARFGRAKLEALVDAEVFVLPSHNENFGNVAAEAIACGVPAVVSNQCGVASSVGGRAARIVPVQSGPMAAAIHEVLFDPAARQALVSRCAEVTRELSWEGRISEMERLYEEVRGRSR